MYNQEGTTDIVSVSLEENPAIVRLRWDAAVLARVVR
jgi:hypothetical protein